MGCKGIAPGKDVRERSHGERSSTSNVLRADYAGSAVCGRCHTEIYSRFVQSPMHRMTRDARTADLRAPFADVEFTFNLDSARMRQVGTDRFLTIRNAGREPRSFLVTKVIGGRYREDFAGTPVAFEGSQPVSPEHEMVLPVSYLIFNGTFRYKGYSVMTPERPELREGPVWRQTCIFCHNTPPHFTTLYDDLHGPGLPTYQGSTSVELPAERAFRYEVTDTAGLLDALNSERALLGSTELEQDDPARALVSLSQITLKQLTEEQLVELGIGCEACHGGAREHVERPLEVRPTFALRSTFMRVTTASGAEPNRAEDINRTCAKCHTVLFSRYPHTWEGGHRRRDPGGSNINSGEARDFLLGGCASQLSCTSCHDPHAEDTSLAWLEGPRGSELCTSCHTALRPAEARTAHTHHPLESQGSACVNCHMPRKNMGLDYSLTRYHRIGSPTDQERVEGDRPIECALCHTDKSAGELIGALERLWGKRYDRAKLEALYGKDLRTNVLTATLIGGKPHERAVAIALSGERKIARSLPLLISELGNPYPLIRFFAHAAIESITGNPLPIDMHAPGPEIVSQAERFLSRGDVASQPRSKVGPERPR